MENNNLEQRIREKMSQHQVPVPDELWQKIESALPPVRPVWYRRPAYVAVAAVAVIAVIVSVFLYIAPSHRVKVPSSEQWTTPLATCSSQQDDSVLHTVADSLDVEATAVPFVEPCAELDVKLCAKNRDDCAIRNIAKDDDTEGCPLSDVCAYWNEEKCGATQTCDSAVCQSNVAARSTHLACTEHNDNNTPAEACETDENTAPLLSCIEPIDDECDDYDVTILREGTTPRGMWVSLTASTSGSQVVTIPFTYRGKDGEVSYNHNMPLNVKALFEKRFDKWSVGAGLSYAYLTSNYEMTGNIRNGRQDMHYVGIPIYFAYEFARINRFSFYASAGAQIDFNTAGKHIESDDSYLYSCIGTYEFRDEKPQVSAQVHVGAAFDVLDQLSLFIEPTLGYYFDNGSCVHTVWQDNPLNFCITVGLRTGF